MYIVPFNPELPLVATQPFEAAGRKFAAGDTVDWRVLDIGPDVVALWWRAKLVVHPLDAVEPVVVEMAFKGEDTKLHVTPGPRVEVETPKQRRKRKPTPDDLSDDELERLTRPE